MEDDEIIELFFARKESALLEVDFKYGKLLTKIAGNILGSRQDIEECVNDVYLGAWNSIPPKRPQQLAAYLCKLTRNVSITRYHHNSAKKRNTMYDVALDELEECLSSKETPERAIEHKELKKQIEAYLDTLSEQDQVIFVRRYWFSDPIGEIARTVGLSETHVSVRLHRIRKGLRKRLQKEGILP